MKKLSYFLTFVAGTMMMASCSNDKEVLSAVEEGTGVQQIVLQVANNGDGLTTRAGRELLSNAATQDIQKVAIVIVDENTDKIAYVANPLDWSVASDYENGKQQTLTIKGDDKLKDGSYTVYAYGYSEPSDYTLPEFNKGDTFSEDQILDAVEAEEIFAGSKFITVADNAFKETVVLNRQVAGSYFYVYNLPYFEDLTTESELRLVACDYNDKLVLGNFANEDIPEENSSVKYVVNGTKANTTTGGEKVVCKAKVGNWYSSINDVNEDGIVDAGENWILTKDASERNGGQYVKGSIFASNFVIPFKSISNVQTLKLVLVKDEKVADNSGDNVLRTWNINLPGDKVTKSLSYYGDSKWNNGVDVSALETKHCYSILRNHLYCVGTKIVDGYLPSTDPENPKPQPGDDADSVATDQNNPEDLSKGQNLILKVNHNWEVIYKMELD